MPNEFTAGVRERDGTTTIDLVGDLDSTAHGPLQAAYGEATATPARVIVLDFSRTGYINSSGIASIVSLLSEASRSQTRLIAHGLDDHYRRIFEITRLTEYIDVVGDENAAMARAARVGSDA